MLEFKDATIAIRGQVLASGLSFIADDGAITCITGPEGAGKTTLLRTLMGFLPVSSGFVSVDGELLTVLSAPVFRKMMVYLPQQSQMLRHQLRPPEAPVCEPGELAVWDALMPAGVTVEPPEVLAADDIFRLAEQTLRGGHDKRIVIADEPAAHLTPELAQQMQELLRQKADEGLTVLIASRIPLLVEHADQVIALKS